MQVGMVVGALLAGAAGCDDNAKSVKEASTGEQRDSAAGEIMATVNGVAISRKDYKSSLHHAEKAYLEAPTGTSASSREVLSQRILGKMIQDELLVQHAVATGINVSKREVQERFEEIKQDGGGEISYRVFVRDRGLDPEMVRRNLWRNLVIERLREKLRAEQEVSPGELRSYYEANAKLFSRPGEVTLAHILFKSKEGGQKPAARAQEIRRRITKGLSFEEAAARHSDDSANSNNGGNLGSFKRGEMLSRLEEAVFSLPVGEVSKPIESPAGVHLLKVIRHNPGGCKPLSEVKAEVVERILDERVAERVEKLVTRLRSEGTVVIE